MKNSRLYFWAEIWVPCSAFLLALSGILTITSGSGTWAYQLEPALRQLFALAVAVVVIFGASFLSFRTLTRRSVPIVLGVGAWLLLGGVLLWGSRINRMCGWYRFGSWSIQPAETVKAIYLLLLCAVLTRTPEKWRFPAALTLAAAWILPIALQPDFGTAAIYAGSFLLLAFCAGVRISQLLGAGVLVGGAFALGAWHLPYILKRLNSFFFASGDQWHLLQFELTVSRGGFLGSNLGKAIWSNAYLPLAYNDSAFATMSETLGFAGAVVIVALLASLVLALLIVANQPDLDTLPRLFIVAAANLIALQSLVHISVNLALIPPTGLNLPFISYGGSSLTGLALLLGLALSAAQSKPPAPDATAPTADR